MGNYTHAPILFFVTTDLKIPVSREGLYRNDFIEHVQ